MIIATIANIFLDLLFIIVFKWGVAGAAVATIVSQGGAFIAAIVYLNKTHAIINLSWRKLNFDKSIFYKNVKIGFPIGFQQAFVALSMMVMYFLVNPFGTNSVAAYSVVFRIDAFAAMPAMNFAAAFSTFVGQNLGANKPHRIKSGLWATFKMTSVVAIVMSTVSLTLAGPLMSMFTNDPEVIEIGKTYLRIVSPFYITFTSMFVISAVMRGAGDTLIPMVITFFALWIVRVPVCYIFSLKFGIIGIWWGLPLAWVTGMGLSYVYYLTGRWKAKVIVKHD